MAEEPEVQEETDEAPDWVKELRQTNKDQAKRIAELEGEVKKARIREAGFDPDAEQGPGKWFSDSYDGDLTVEAIQETAETYGFATPQQQETQTQDEQRRQVASRTETLRTQSTPQGSRTVDFAEYQRLKKSDPAEAMRLKQEGVVEYPPEIASELSAQRGG